MRFSKTCKIQKTLNAKVLNRFSRLDGNARLEVAEDKSSGILMATNGRSIVRVPVEVDAEDTTGSVPIAALKEATKGSAKGQAQIIANGSVRVTTNSGEVTMEREEATFPPLGEKIIEDASANDHAILILNPKILFELAQSMGSAENIEIRIPEPKAETNYRASITEAIVRGPIYVKAMGENSGPDGAIMPIARNP